MMNTITIDNEVLITMLENRIDFWTNDPIVQELYSEMYENYVDAGCFDGFKEFDPMVIVDNDYVNYCSVIELENGEEAPSVGEEYDSDDYGLVTVEARYNYYDGRTALLVRS